MYSREHAGRRICSEAGCNSSYAPFFVRLQSSGEMFFMDKFITNHVTWLGDAVALLCFALVVSALVSGKTQVKAMTVSRKESPALFCMAVVVYAFLGVIFYMLTHIGLTMYR